MMPIVAQVLTLALSFVVLTSANAAASSPTRRLGQKVPQPTHCFDVYPHVLKTKTVINGNTFTGVKYGAELVDINDPFYSTEAEAIKGGGTPQGRALGFFSEVTGSGIVALEFFKTGSWLSLNNGQGPNGVPNVVLGGTGCFLGATGTIDRTAIEGGFRYHICTTAALPCSP